ncbi:MAG: oligosaccharide flippase family protein, partial [Aliifodinibius sp.]|nr:oligosaccharide flippase family protein [Candidatus Saccharibacteria bacterium]NIS45079.1 oligosaccharide flippase family protein [candidate division Zixibacteria bacterium]NIT61223.1 oligosaccharide flippase family protein [Fodinibius sp.]NIU13190.1 oligosaccharide flippase family protein [candidate division Zixibacteria bacterium]NIV05236.1 oligosaccharide flippase family protein [candidate division Zixibacteria bacterium]
QKGDVNTASDTAFILTLTSGIVLTFIAYLSAPLVAAFFNDDRIIPIVQVLSFSLLITNLGNVHQARLTKSLDFKRRAIPEI